MKHPAKVLIPALLSVVAVAACVPSLTNRSTLPTQLPVMINGRTSVAYRSNPVVLVGAGDIAYDGPGAEITAKLLDEVPGTVFTLGDNAYKSGALTEFVRYYVPTWGRHLNRTRPVVGNHEYRTAAADGYFDYFGDRAGDRTKGYYSYDLGPTWHVVVLNSAASGTDGASANLGPFSEQYRWAAQDLDAHRGQNVIAMWHHPRFSSGVHGDNKETDELWRLVQSKGADIALWGHDHDYERFYPMDVNGNRDDANGIQAFVVGSGGAERYPFVRPAKRTTAVRNAKTFGVLKLTLQEKGYDWEFVPEAGASFTDEGSASVH